MKKHLVIFFLIVIASAVLTGCVTLTGTYDLLHDASKISSVEIYHLTEYAEFELPEEVEPVTSLDPAVFSEFCTDIQSLRYTDVLILFPMAVDPSWGLMDYVVKIIYINGDFEVIGNYGYQTQEVVDGSGSSNRHYSFDGETWVSFIEKYID